MTNQGTPTLARVFFQVLAARATPLLGVCALVLAGCGGTTKGTSDEGRRDDAGELFQGKAGAQARGEEPGGTWTIAIVAIRKSPDESVRQDEEMAAAALDKVKTVAGISQAYLDERGGAYVVAFGSYTSATDPKAQADLKRLQGFVFEGSKPFAAAVLTPPDAAVVEGGNPELNLLSVGRDPMSTAKYTLQVGVYGRVDGVNPSAADLAEFRKAAEQAAAQLRREGEQAYYYHGPTKSMVLVGAFDSREFDERKPAEQAEGPVIRALRQKFPYNLVNGAGYRERTAGEKEGRMQKSQIVRIPQQ